MRFEFATAGRIIFGAGTAGQLGEIAREFGRRALVVTGAEPSRWSGLVESVRIAGVDCAISAVQGEPTVEAVRDAARAFQQHHAELVISIGGGSVMDAGKAIAAVAANSGEPMDYLEVVGRGQPLAHDALPHIAVPTTAGTGAEVTRNAVLGSKQHGVKASLRHRSVLPRVAIVDPELTRGTPPHVTAASGLDALTQVIEPFVSVRANAMTDLFCREGLKAVRENLARAYRDGSDLEARGGMSWAALMGGLALANAGLGVVHGFAAPVGGSFDAPHGAVCAALLPFGMEVNIRALRARDPAAAALTRYEEAARILTGRPGARAEDGTEWVEALCLNLQIKRLSSFGVRAGEDLVQKAAKASSMQANPIVLTREELTEVLQRAI